MLKKAPNPTQNVQDMIEKRYQATDEAVSHSGMLLSMLYEDETVL